MINDESGPVIIVGPVEMYEERGKGNMPYKKNEELPDSVKDNLPSHGQTIYREAFNNAWDTYSDPDKRRGDASREETAHRVAWAAVKKEYDKDEKTGKWKKK